MMNSQYHNFGNPSHYSHQPYTRPFSHNYTPPPQPYFQNDFSYDPYYQDYQYTPPPSYFHEHQGYGPPNDYACWNESSYAIQPSFVSIEEHDCLDRRVDKFVYEAKQDMADLGTSIKKEIQDEMAAYREETLQPLRRMEATLAGLIEEVTRRNQMEAQTVMLTSTNTPPVPMASDEVVSNAVVEDAPKIDKEDMANIQSNTQSEEAISKPQSPIPQRHTGKEGCTPKDIFFQSLKQWYLNIPFERPEQVPQYVKDMKEFITLNRSLVGENFVIPGEEPLLEGIEHGKEGENNVVISDDEEVTTKNNKGGIREEDTTFLRIKLAKFHEDNEWYVCLMEFVDARHVGAYH